MLKIRQAQSSDADALTLLAQQCEKHQRHTSAGDYVPHYQPNDFSQYYIALAETPELTGFYQLDFIAKEDTAVSVFFVAPGDEHGAYASALFKHAKIQAKVLGAERLLIVSDNLSVLLDKKDIEINQREIQQVSGNTAIRYAINLTP